MIGAIYVRTSTAQTDVSGEAQSVARQIERAKAYAHRKGWTVGGEPVDIDDSMSGVAFENRPGLAVDCREEHQEPRQRGHR